MSTAQHTPGPWDVQANTVWATSPWNARFKLALVHEFSQMNGIDHEANCRLIAAAPDLLAALKRLISRTEKTPDAMNALKEARAAIAKATGSAA